MKVQHQGLKVPFVVCALSLAVGGVFTACGEKNSVEDNETPTGPVRTDSRSRLTGGNTSSGGSGATAMSYCRMPLDMATQLDSRRSGLTQNVLTTAIDTRCAQYQEVRITLKSRQKINLVGKFICRSGVQFNEQVCTGNTQDLVSNQKNSITIPVIVDDSWRPGDIEALAEFF